MTSEIHERPPRLLCDEMLARLCRWLRAAGYDAAHPEPGTPDRDLMQRALAEQRLLITRDRGFLERRGAAEHVLLVPCTTLDDQARLLRRRLGVDWLYRPFTRCLVCNAPLQETSEVLRYCAMCDKSYWEGSHVRRMRARLIRWAAS